MKLQNHLLGKQFQPFKSSASEVSAEEINGSTRPNNKPALHYMGKLACMKGESEEADFLHRDPSLSVEAMSHLDHWNERDDQDQRHDKTKEKEEKEDSGEKKESPTSIQARERGKNCLDALANFCASRPKSANIKKRMPV